MFSIPWMFALNSFHLCSMCSGIASSYSNARILSLSIFTFVDHSDFIIVLATIIIGARKPSGSYRRAVVDSMERLVLVSMSSNLTLNVNMSNDGLHWMPNVFTWVPCSESTFGLLNLCSTGIDCRISGELLPYFR